MKNLKHKSITKLNYKIISSTSLISLSLLFTSNTSKAMLPSPNSVLRLFSNMTSSIGRIFRSSRSNTHDSNYKISKSFDKSNSNKSVLSTTLGTPESNKTSNIKLTKFSDGLTGETSSSLLSGATLHKPRKNRKNIYKISESSSSIESPTPKKSTQAVSPSSSTVIKNFDRSLKRKNKEFNEMFEQNMKLKREGFRESQEFLNNVRKEVNSQFLGHSSKS